MYQGIYQHNLAEHPLMGSLFAGYQAPDVLIDARYLSCPMPLLKVKLALKTSPDSLYVVTTDPNSATDLARFCQKHHLFYDSWQSDEPDTFFHRILTKNAGI